MATAKPASSTSWPRRLGWLVLLGLVVAGLTLLPRLMQYARTASAYGARVGCACHYIGGRPLDDCRKDFEAGMGPVWLSEDAAAHTVTARYGLLAPQTATWSQGPGCVLESWKE